MLGFAGAASAQAPAPPTEFDVAAANANPVKGVRFVPQGITPNAFFDSPETKVGSLEVKLGQGRILVLKESLTAPGGAQPVIALGDPSIADFVLLAPRQLRIVGRRLGTTDLSVTSADGKTYSIDIRVIANLDPLLQQIRKVFPSAHVKLSQVLDQIFVEGEVRDARQASQILRTISSYLQTQQGVSLASARNATAGPAAPPGDVPPPPAPGLGGGAGGMQMVQPSGNDGSVSGPADITPNYYSIVNLLRVPGSQQILLKVRIAELNRDAFRQVGANFFTVASGNILGTQVGGANILANGSNVFNGIPGNKLIGTATSAASTSTTFFGILQPANLEFLLNVLRRVQLLKILAEPNLIALNGQQASFLSGGEFPVPVPQVSASGVAPTITVQFKKFGVQLDFLPTILDGDIVRLTVDPVVSTIDFTVGATLVAGGSPVPGLNTRQAHTTVELRPGQSLAIAGLLTLTLSGQTNRIPGLGDLPVLGPFFSNNTGERIEKELVVLVTPYLVEPMAPNQVPLGPGDEVGGPTDWEFYFLNRTESRTGKDWRSTTDYADPAFIQRYLDLERKNVQGPSGYSG
jgi:pilus assembly protein CpaC